MVNEKMRRLRGKYVGGRSRWFYLLRGVLCSVLITAPCIVILSFLMMLSDFSEEYLSPIVLVAMPLCIVFSSFLSTLGSKNSGWFNGTITGSLYGILVLIVRFMLEGGIYIDKDCLLTLLGCALIGSIGGMAGILIGKRFDGKR